MSKQKIAFECNNCHFKPLKWVGCCPGCQEWGSIIEVQPAAQKKKTVQVANTLKSLAELSSIKKERLITGINEWDRVLGGGIVPGSLLILTGDPGIGKSTLLLQISYLLAENNSILYFSSEESLEQIKNRAERIACVNENLLFSDSAQLESIIALSEQQKPDVIIVDSIQNCYCQETRSIPGTIGQLREAAFQFMRLAKENDIAVILTGHITKEGTIAGPKMLEHMVDGVFYLQGEDKYQTRILRSVKNRFGPIFELGFFQMQQTGLVEVTNINQQLLEDATFSPGSVLISYIEGSQPLLLELQALTVPTKYGMPQRVVTGVDHKQVVLIASILEKYLHIKFHEHDIFFKVSGKNFKIKDHSIDLGIACALLSSFYQKPLPERTIALGEISLTGIIKPVNTIEMHMNEAQKYGITSFLIAKNQKTKQKKYIQRFSHVYELLNLFSD